ncbi:MAG: ACP S-malonyltransferase [Rhodospirillaceae bacterium]|jgi:[acyl-carrier-protein] S-malonyltransferase|nr:ACP S-malonyltransferase [Rhodospirillaceae bacterium]
MSRAIVFPGQGVQIIGMGHELAKAFPVARDVFNEVDEALKQKLSKLMWEGSESELNLTENAQPALMAVSIAIIRILANQGNWIVEEKADLIAGHSLGEYSALVAAGTFTLSDAARLLKTRGQAMQKAVPINSGAMAVLLGIEVDQVREIISCIEENDVCEIANDNAPGQVVISGTKIAIEHAIIMARMKGAKRSMPLKVSAPFHCSLMYPAAKVVANALDFVTMLPPVVPMVSNVTASFTNDPEEIRQLLITQMTEMVRWRESILAMKMSGVNSIVEIGVGNVLTNLTKRIDKEIITTSLQTQNDIDIFLS